MPNKLRYQRILLKLSGEALMGNDAYGINTKVLEFVADEVKEVVKTGVELGLVIGAGNIFRGVAGASKEWTGRQLITWACWPR